jgi:hypothetical protein
VAATGVPANAGLAPVVTSQATTTTPLFPRLPWPDLPPTVRLGTPQWAHLTRDTADSTEVPWSSRLEPARGGSWCTTGVVGWLVWDGPTPDPVETHLGSADATQRLPAALLALEVGRPSRMAAAQPVVSDRLAATSNRTSIPQAGSLGAALRLRGKRVTLHPRRFVRWALAHLSNPPPQLAVSRGPAMPRRRKTQGRSGPPASRSRVPAVRLTPGGWMTGRIPGSVGRTAGPGSRPATSGWARPRGRSVSAA